MYFPVEILFTIFSFIRQNSWNNCSFFEKHSFTLIVFPHSHSILLLLLCIVGSALKMDFNFVFHTNGQKSIGISFKIKIDSRTCVKYVMCAIQSLNVETTLLNTQQKPKLIRKYFVSVLFLHCTLYLIIIIGWRLCVCSVVPLCFSKVFFLRCYSINFSLNRQTSAIVCGCHT